MNVVFFLCTSLWGITPQEELAFLQTLQAQHLLAQQAELHALQQLTLPKLSAEQKIIIQDTIDTFNVITSQTTPQLAHDLFETLLEPFFTSSDVRLLWPATADEQLTTLKQTYSLLNIMSEIMTVLKAQRGRALSDFILSGNFIADAQAAHTVLPLLQNLQSLYNYHHKLTLAITNPAQQYLAHRLHDGIIVKLLTIQHQLRITRYSIQRI